MSARVIDDSPPPTTGWRPGARWARAPSEGKAPATNGTCHFCHLHPADKPLVTIEKSAQRIIIAAACPAALTLGIAPGLALTQARALVPELDVRDAEPAADAALLNRLALFAARRWTPRAAVCGGDGLWLDLTGVAHLFGGERAMARRILRFCARLGLTAHIAITDTAGAAYALARYGGERLLCCPPGGQGETIASLPIAALRIDEETILAAHRLGIERIGELGAMPRGPLARRFGAELLLRLDQALGHTGEAIEPIVPEEPPSAMVRFVEPIATAEAIGEAMRHLMELLAGALEEQGLGARRLTLLCMRIDGEEQTVTVGTARATRDSRHLLSLLVPRIETIDPGFGIEAMRLVAGRCEPLAPQPIDSGWSGEQAAPDLVPLIDRLTGRLGPRRLFKMSAVESDVPERSLKRVPPLDPAVDWPPDWPRPARLLIRPEPVEQGVALLPDGPPRRFTWRGKTHVVRRADGPERIYGEWWKHRGEAEAVRDYFQVEDESGARFWLFRRGDGADARTGDLRWYLQGVF